MLTHCVSPPLKRFSLIDVSKNGLRKSHHTHHIWIEIALKLMPLNAFKHYSWPLHLVCVILILNVLRLDWRLQFDTELPNSLWKENRGQRYTALTFFMAGSLPPCLSTTLMVDPDNSRYFRVHVFLILQYAPCGDLVLVPTILLRTAKYDTVRVGWKNW